MISVTAVLIICFSRRLDEELDSFHVHRLVSMETNDVMTSRVQ